MTESEYTDNTASIGYLSNHMPLIDFSDSFHEPIVDLGHSFYDLVGRMKTVTRLNERHMVGHIHIKCDIVFIMYLTSPSPNERWKWTVNMISTSTSQYALNIGCLCLKMRESWPRHIEMLTLNLWNMVIRLFSRWLQPNTTIKYIIKKYFNYGIIN